MPRGTNGLSNGQLGIVANALSVLSSGDNGYASIYRPFDFSAGIRVQADLSAGANGRYKGFFTLFGDGTFAIPYQSQHGIEVF